METLIVPASATPTVRALTDVAARRGLVVLPISLRDPLTAVHSSGRPHLFGGPLLAARLQQRSPLALLEPRDDWLITLPERFVRRRVRLLPALEAYGLQEQHPGTPRGVTSVSLRAANSTEVLRSVMAGEAELGFVEGAERPAGVSSTEIGRDDLVLVVSATDRLARRRTPLTPTQVAGLSLTSRERGSGTREVVEQALAAHGLTMAAQAIEVTTSTAVRETVRAGGAPAFLSRYAVEADLRAGTLALVRTRDLTVSRQLRAVWVGGTDPPPAQSATCSPSSSASRDPRPTTGVPSEMSQPPVPPRHLARREPESGADNPCVVHPGRMVESGPPSTTGSRTAVGSVACLVAAFGTWMAWFAWDTVRDVHPGTTGTTGPYDLWQGIGAAATLLVLIVVALRWLTAVHVVLAVSLGFTAEFTFSGATDPQADGLYVIGAGLLLGVMLLSSAVVAWLARFLVHRPAAHPPAA